MQSCKAVSENYSGGGGWRLATKVNTWKPQVFILSDNVEKCRIRGKRASGNFITALKTASQPLDQKSKALDLPLRLLVRGRRVVEVYSR